MSLCVGRGVGCRFAPNGYSDHQVQSTKVPPKDQKPACLLAWAGLSLAKLLACDGMERARARQRRGGGAQRVRWVTTLRRHRKAFECNNPYACFASKAG